MGASNVMIWIHYIIKKKKEKIIRVILYVVKILYSKYFFDVVTKTGTCIYI